MNRCESQMNRVNGDMSNGEKDNGKMTYLPHPVQHYETPEATHLFARLAHRCRQYTLLGLLELDLSRSPMVRPDGMAGLPIRFLIDVSISV